MSADDQIPIGAQGPAERSERDASGISKRRRRGDSAAESNGDGLGVGRFALVRDRPGR